jgi:hypothetical protein
MPFKNWVIVFWFACTSLAAWAQTADAFIVKRAVDLRSAPGEGAASLGTLAEKSPITRLTRRQGAWIEVKTAQGAVGWLHLFDVSAPTTAGGGGAADALRGVTHFFNRGGTPTVVAGQTSTVGIRGLGAEDLARAQPNMGAVQQAEGLRLTSNQARAFGRDAKLSVQAVDSLPIPPEPGQVNAANRP